MIGTNKCCWGFLPQLPRATLGGAYRYQHFVTASGRARLEAIVAARSSPQKHVWRARIILLTAQGLGTNAIMVATARSKTCVWRWQERFMAEGVEGLVRDKTRPPGIAPHDAVLVDRVVALTLEAPGHEATHWTVRAMAKSVGIAASSVVKIVSIRRVFQLPTNDTVASAAPSWISMSRDQPRHIIILPGG